MKQVSLILSFLFIASVCFGQKEHLELEKDNYRKNRIDSILSDGFSQNPYARFTSTDGYSFSIEIINGKKIIIYNRYNDDYWRDDIKDTAPIITKKTEINDDLYLKIGELFKLVTEQAKEVKLEWIEKSDTLPDGTVIEIEHAIIRSDGTTYTFKTTDENGVIKAGSTWSPQTKEKPMQRRLVEICDKLCSIENENIPQDIALEIDKLISYFK